MLNSYKELTVWQKSKDLVKEVYRLVKLLPKEETYALSDQMRRAVISIPSNIAEGWGRSGDKDYPRFLSVALGSNFELETQLIICGELGLIPENELEQAQQLTDEISKMLNALISKLKK